VTDPEDGSDPGDPDDGGRPDHPDLSGIAGDMRAEWRDEQEAAAADAATQLRHGRSLTDWLRDRMHAGDRIGVTVAAQTFVGLVEEVGEDLLVLRGAAGVVEIHVCAAIAISFELVEHATRGGRRASARRTFCDALLARDTRTDVAIGTRQHPDGLHGTLLVGRDYVSIVTAARPETIVPIADIAWVAPSLPD
jgi:hypothetical protein